MTVKTKVIEQKVENSSGILPVFSNVTVTYPHYDIERIQEQRHKQFQYVCDKYKDEIPPNVSHNNVLLKSSTLWQIDIFHEGFLQNNRNRIHTNESTSILAMIANLADQRSTRTLFTMLFMETATIHGTTKPIL